MKAPAEKQGLFSVTGKAGILPALTGKAGFQPAPSIKCWVILIIPALLVLEAGWNPAFPVKKPAGMPALPVKTNN